MSNRIDHVQPENKEMVVTNLKILEQFTGLTIAPPPLPNWEVIHTHELLQISKTLAVILLLQQTITNQRNEEIRLQKIARQRLSPVELDLVPLQNPTIKDHELCAKLEELYPIMLKLKIDNREHILLQLQKAGLITLAYEYFESSSSKLIGYKIPASKIDSSTELINKWGLNATQ